MNKLFTVCVLMATCKIAHGNPFFDLTALISEADETPPRGFHYEPRFSIQASYPRNTYRVMPMKNAFALLAERAGMTSRSKRGFLDALWPGRSDSVDTAVAASASEEGYLDRIGSAVKNVAEDVESSLVEAAPYLPMVTKVALFVVPGLREYQMLMMALNVATITSQAYKRYNDGESATTVAASAAWQMFTLKKRNTDYTLKEYAQNMYNSLRESLASRFQHVPMFSRNSDADLSSTTDLLTSKTEVVSSIDENVGFGAENGMKTITSTVTKSFRNGVDTPDILMTVTKHYENGIEMANNQISTSDEMTVSAISQNPKIDETSDESEEEDTSENKENNNEEIEIDKSLFAKYLDESMRLQPEFIQQKSGEELVQFLDSLEINLPSLAAVDSSNTFYALTRTMNFDDNVTNEQINRLVDVLTKATNYFIDAAIHTKQGSMAQV